MSRLNSTSCPVTHLLWSWITSVIFQLSSQISQIRFERCQKNTHGNIQRSTKLWRCAFQGFNVTSCVIMQPLWNSIAGTILKLNTFKFADCIYLQSFIRGKKAFWKNFVDFQTSKRAELSLLGFWNGPRWSTPRVDSTYITHLLRSPKARAIF